MNDFFEGADRNVGFFRQKSHVGHKLACAGHNAVQGGHKLTYGGHNTPYAGHRPGA